MDVSKPLYRTNAKFKSYIKEVYVPKANATVINELARVYPNDPTKGSPFNTGFANMLTPQFKRLAAFQGDAVFQAPRRFFLQKQSDKQNAWAYCMYLSLFMLNGMIMLCPVSKRAKWIPFLGAVGCSFFLLEIRKALILYFFARHTQPTFSTYI
jgi:acetylcholinesterase